MLVRIYELRVLRQSFSRLSQVHHCHLTWCCYQWLKYCSIMWKMIQNLLISIKLHKLTQQYMTRIGCFIKRQHKGHGVVVVFSFSLECSDWILHFLVTVTLSMKNCRPMIENFFLDFPMVLFLCFEVVSL